VRTDRTRTARCLALTVTATLALGALVPARVARAEVKVAQGNRWSVTFDGRINSFLSVSRGAAIPLNEQNYTGLDDEATPDNQIANARVRSGFIENVFGVELTNQLTEDTSLKVRVGMWILAASQRTWGDEPAMDAREAYFKLEGPFGSLTGGRAMSLFSRGNILMDYDLEHNYGLGHPCAVKVVSGGACGHSGFGVLFPGFHSGLVYATPVLGGFQVAAGLYDPVQLAEGAYRRTPLPRAEAEASLSPSKHFRAFASFLWQPLSRNDMNTDANGNTTTTSQDVTAAGVAYGLMLSGGPLALGASGYYGQGLGLYTPLEDNPTNILSTGNLRKQDGYYGGASLTFGDTRVAAGAGISRLAHDVSDPASTGNVITPKQQVGFSGGVYQGAFNKTIFFAVEYFRAITTWFDRGQPDPTDPTLIDIIRPRQAVNFFNVGATVVW
jgi:Gram-negative porin